MRRGRSRGARPRAPPGPGQVRAQQREQDLPDQVEADEQQPRQQGAGEQIDRPRPAPARSCRGRAGPRVGALKDVADEIEHGRGRDDLAERARGADRAGRRASGRSLRNMAGSASRPMVTTVAPTIPVEAASSMPTIVTDMAEPARPAGRTARPWSRSSCSAMPRALEHHAHEDEQRHRDQHLVDHHAELARRQAGKQMQIEDAEHGAEQREERRPGEGERDRETQQETPRTRRRTGRSRAARRWRRSRGRARG